MSERDYFSLRYTLPGLVLVLIIVGLNARSTYYLLIGFRVTDVLALVISILTLFASTAIGFLISQVWFAIYHRKREWAKLLGINEPRMQEIMQQSLGLKIKAEPSIDREPKIASAVDYVLNNQPDNIVKFLQRKIDLYHTMSCVLISLIIGLLIGSITRIWCLTNGFTIVDSVLCLATAIMGIFFVLLFNYLRKEILFEYSPTLKIALSNLGEEIKYREIYAKAFPDIFDPEPEQNH